jgi:hypothetical protein
MNNQLAEIAFILDRSGSMKPLQEAAVTAFNAFVKSQLDVPGDAHLTLVQFDDAYEVPVLARPLKEVPELTAATYVPRGSTALLDAIGRTITETARRLDGLLGDKKPGKVIMAIFTDGHENASREYNSKQTNELIRVYRDTHGWEFLFLAANQDAIASAAALHMDAHLSSSVEFSAKGMHSGWMAGSRKIRSLRMKASGTMDQQAMADDRKNLAEIIKEEDEKNNKSEA